MTRNTFNKNDSEQWEKRFEKITNEFDQIGLSSTKELLHRFIKKTLQAERARVVKKLEGIKVKWANDGLSISENPRTRNSVYHFSGGVAAITDAIEAVKGI